MLYFLQKKKTFLLSLFILIFSQFKFYSQTQNSFPLVSSKIKSAYLSGVLAALQSISDKIENPVFGFICDISNKDSVQVEMAYIQGIKSIIPNAGIKDLYLKGKEKSIQAFETSSKWYDENVFCIFTYCDKADSGVLISSKEKNLFGKTVWCIAVRSECYYEGIYTGKRSSVLTVFSEDESKFLKIENPRIKNHTVSKLDKIKQELSENKILIYLTYADALKAGIAPAGLNAKD